MSALLLENLEELQSGVGLHSTVQQVIMRQYYFTIVSMHQIGQVQSKHATMEKQWDRVTGRAENNCYISELSIIVTSGMIGESIECAHDNGTTHIIGGSTVVAATGTYAQLPEVQVIELKQKKNQGWYFQQNCIPSSCKSKFHVAIKLTRDRVLIHYLVYTPQCLFFSF